MRIAPAAVALLLGALLLQGQQQIPDHPDKLKYPPMKFEVPDAAAAVASLAARGVVFEDYDLPGLKTVDKVCILGSEKAAWFKDTEGNILCIHENLH